MELKPFDRRLLRGLLRGLSTEELAYELGASFYEVHLRTLKLADKLSESTLPGGPQGLPEVRHERLSQLLALWNRRRQGGRLPAHADLRFTDLQPWIGNLSINEVDSDGERFKLRVVGRRLIEYHDADYSGRYLNDVAPPETQHRVLAPQRRALHERRPQYDILGLTDPDGMGVNLHRLALPCARNGRDIDIMILGIYLERNGEEPPRAEGKLFELIQAAAA